MTDHLARLPEVRAIYYTSGESDLIAEVWLASADALLHFLAQRIAAIPGIRSTATSHVLRTIKDGVEYEVLLTPAQSERPAIGIVRIQTDCPIKRHQQLQAFGVVRAKLPAGAATAG
mgnify:CR=1 FL=1